jgi:putative ABC transport system permease protein
MRELTTSLIMLLRRLAARPWGTGLSLFSLATGICAFLILTGIASYELSYDRWVPDGDRVFRLETTIAPTGAEQVRTTSVSARAGAMLSTRLPGLEASARVLSRSTSLKVHGREFRETVALSEPGFLRIFPLQVIGGNLEEALARPDRIAVSRATAVKLFGSPNAVGQPVEVAGGGSAAVAAVFEDLPRNSHLVLETIGSIRSPLFVDLAAAEQDWLDLGGYFYVKTKEPMTAALLGRSATQSLTAQAPMLKDAGLAATIGAFPLDELHVRAAPADQLPLGGFKPLIDYARVQVIAVVAVLVIALAGFNYAFYLSSLVSSRSREIALRQVAGARPRRIYLLFFCDALMSVLLAFALALLALSLAQPWWARFAEGEPGFADVAASSHAALILVAMLVLAGLVALFPYALARRVRPADTLRNRAAATAVRARVVRAVMTAQIAMAVALMLAAVSVAKQVDRLSNAPLGFREQGVLVVKSLPPSVTPARAEALMQEMTRLEGVAGSAAAQDEVGVGLVRATANVQAPSLAHEISMNFMAAEGRWFTLMDVRPVAGRLLADREADQVKRPAPGPAAAEPPAFPVLVNETAARSLGFSRAADAIGKPISASLDMGWSQPFTIVGVIPDIAHASLREGSRPYFYFDRREQESLLYVRFEGDLAAARQRIEAQLKAMFPESPPTVGVLADDIAKHYENEARLRLVFGTGSLLVLAIALMGIAALSNTIVTYRMREIALRKLFGASPAQIVRLIAWQFGSPLLIGYTLAGVAAWILVLRWLNGFSLRAPPGVAEFAGVFIAIVAAAGLTASVFVVRLLRLRPAAVLRYE